MMDILLRCAGVLWDFYRVNHVLKKSDVLLLLGNDDPRTATHAATLVREGWARHVLVSGNEGTGTRGKYSKTEAEVFRDLLVKEGVPEEDILLEPEATNTGENIVFSQRLLRARGVTPRSVLAVTKSCMELRVALTFAKQWEDAHKVALTVSSPFLTLEEYPSPDVGDLDAVVEYLVDTFPKLRRYAELGHQMPISIPAHVERAHQMLAAHIAEDKARNPPTPTAANTPTPTPTPTPTLTATPAPSASPTSVATLQGAEQDVAKATLDGVTQNNASHVTVLDSSRGCEEDDKDDSSDDELIMTREKVAHHNKPGDLISEEPHKDSKQKKEAK